MYVTPKEAEKMICPYMSDSSVMQPCQNVKCMAWRWHRAAGDISSDISFQKADIVDELSSDFEIKLASRKLKDITKEEPTGFCGIPVEPIK